MRLWSDKAPLQDRDNERPFDNLESLGTRGEVLRREHPKTLIIHSINTPKFPLVKSQKRRRVG